ncbi:unnamed protein product [Closterium sp. NIES-54]
MVDDYSCCTTVIPLQRKADVLTILEPWLLARGDAQALSRLCLHSDRGVRYAAHQLNPWPSDAWPRVTPVSLWTGSPGVAADYRVWGFPGPRSRPWREQVVSAHPCLPPPLSRPAPSGVSHVTPQSPPSQRPVLVVSGGAGGAVEEGEGTGAAGAHGADFGGAVGLREEATHEEDTAVSTQQPHPLASCLFRSSVLVRLRGRSLRSLWVFLPEALESLGVLLVEILDLGVQLQPQQERVEQEPWPSQQVLLQPQRERSEEEPQEQQRGQVSQQQSPEEAEQQRRRDLPDSPPARFVRGPLSSPPVPPVDSLSSS